MKHGKLPEFIRCEAFIDCKRIPGGDRHSFLDLPTGKYKLTQHDNIQSLCLHMKKWRRSRDGCASQYQGKKSFRGQQIMSARHQMECKDTRNPAKQGKDIADGEGHAVGGMVENEFNDDYRDGKQNLVRHLYSKHPQPNTERRTRYYGMRGLYVLTR